MSKRPAEFDDNDRDNSSPIIPIKQFVSSYEQYKFDNIRSIDEMNSKTLQIQNKKLVECLQDQKTELNSMKERIEQLEDRQAKDDEMMCIVNKYWNILDEDCQLLLNRFELANESKMSEEVEYFLRQLAIWDKDQLETKLKERVHFSKRIISKLIETVEIVDTKSQSFHDGIHKSSKKSIKKEEIDSTDDKTISMDLLDEKEIKEEYIDINEEVKRESLILTDDNKRLKKLCWELQTEHHKLKSENLEMKDKVENYLLKQEELKSKYDEVEYNLAETNRDYNRMNRWLMESKDKNKALKEEIQMLKGGINDNDDNSNGANSSMGMAPRSKLNELSNELEDMKELAARRLNELEKLEKKYQHNLEEITRLKSQEIEEATILESVQYKSLHAQFNILYKEAVNMQAQLEEARVTIQTNRQHHLKQIEEMEMNEGLIQNQMRADMMVLREENSKLRNEYETLDLELKQTICHNQHSAPIASEMRSLIDTLRVQANQAKLEAQRTRKKYKELQMVHDKLKLEYTQLDKELAEVKIKLRRAALLGSLPNSEISSSNLPLSDDESIIKDLNEQLSKSKEDLSEMESIKAALNQLESDEKDKTELLAEITRLKQDLANNKLEIGKLRSHVDKRLQEPDPDQLRRNRKMEETLRDYQQKLAIAKQQEDAMINDSNITTQAYEDVLEQNSRLLQTLKEKDENNLKLMTDRMKANQTAKLLKEDQQLLEDQIKMYKTQIEALNRSLVKQEEKERLFLTNLNSLEKESTARQQSLELHKRKAMEYQQTAEDLRMNLQKYLSQLKESQTSLQDKAAAQSRDLFKQRRIKDDLMLLKRKYDRIKRLEHSGNADEVLQTEIQTYKDILTCPTCKSNKKDAILTKCFHVFCLSCLKTRYEMRNRKCPKCNATFGANDYHHIYLA